MSNREEKELAGMVNAMLESDILHYKSLAELAESKLELAIKALEDIKCGIEWNWETYVDIASDALDEIRRNTNA